MNVPEIDPSPGIDIGKMDRKIWWRITPFILVLYVISILDRINIGYAALTMNAELGIDPFLFGFISGIFFISYILFEVPGNQILARTGARIWLFRIMVSWGIIAMLMAVVSTPLELGILRFFLGAAEAGFAPGLILYLSFWFRKEKIAKALAVFFIAIPLAMMIASPLSAFILSHASWFEISGWRWLFLLEGLPAVFFGCAILVCLSDLPEKARWLTPHERAWLGAHLDGDRVKEATTQKIPFRQLAGFPMAIILCASSFFVGLFLTGLLFWFPQIVHSSGLSGSVSDTGMLVMIPYGLSAVVMYAWSLHSDAARERRYHVAIPFFLAAVLLLALSLPHGGGTAAGFLILTGAIAACYAAYAPFFALTLEIFPPDLRASGTALVNTTASMGAFFGPVIFGLLGGQITGPVAILMLGLLGIALMVCGLCLLRCRE
ncbi:MAG: MFS transporter [Methanoregula sp.]|nr:MFS transporter [Methanoregula sp.]